MKKRFLVIALLIILLPMLNAQEKSEDNYFKKNFQQRMVLGLFASYYNDNIVFMCTGYEAVLKLINLTPDFNLIDFGLGLNVLLAFDNRGDVDWQGRPFTPRITPGFDLYYTFKIYIPLLNDNIRIFIEPLILGLVVFTRPYPETDDAIGTYVNQGTQFGLGVEYRINPILKSFMKLQWFHASNHKEYSNNPALEGIGILTGLQF